MMLGMGPMTCKCILHSIMFFQLFLSFKIAPCAIPYPLQSCLLVEEQHTCLPPFATSELLPRYDFPHHPIVKLSREIYLIFYAMLSSKYFLAGVFSANSKLDQPTPHIKKPKAHTRGATMPGASTPGSVQSPSTPGSVSTGFAGYANTLVPPGPHVQSTTSQSTDSVDGGNVQTASSEGSASTGNKKSGGIFGKFFRKEPKQGGTKSNEDLPFRGQNLYGRSQEVAIDPNQYDPLVEMGNLPTPDFIRPLPGQRLIPRREPNALSRVAANPLPTTQIGRARAMAAARLNESVSEALESDWQTTINSDGDRSTMNFSLSFDQSVRELVRVTDSQEQHRLIVLASAPVADEASIAAWSNYVQLYSDVSDNPLMLDF